MCNIHILNVSYYDHYIIIEVGISFSASLCIYLNHFALYLKLTQHCKSTVVQFLKSRIDKEVDSASSHKVLDWEE